MQSVIQALRILAFLAAAVLLLRVWPDLEFTRSPGPGTLIAAIIIILMPSLALFRGIEWWAEKITGYRVPLGRRAFIPVPAFLWLATWVKAIVAPFGGYGTGGELELYGNTSLAAAVLLPFLLLEDVRTPVRFIIGVWAAYAIWMFLIVLLAMSQDWINWRFR